MSPIRLVLAGLLLSGITSSANAASILIYEAAPGSTPITDLSTFTRTGNFTERFENLLGITIRDLHMTFFFPQGVPDFVVDDVFDNSQTTFERSGSSLTVNFQGGPGVPPGGFFTLEVFDFEPDTVFRITPTVPEPSSVILAASGLAGTGLLGLSRRRNRGKVDQEA